MIKIERSKKGLPCIWEKGGSYTNTGECTLVCDANGNPKVPIYVRTRGPLACSEHALIPVRVGDHIVEFYQHRGDFEIDIKRITSISDIDDTIECKGVNRFYRGEWDTDLHQKFERVVSAGRRKSQDYHCRSPYFIREKS